MPTGSDLGLCRGCRMETESWRGGLGPACARDAERERDLLLAAASRRPARCSWARGYSTDGSGFIGLPCGECEACAAAPRSDRSPE